MSKLGDIAIMGGTLPDLNKREKVVLGHIANCHTERMGGNTFTCECGHREIHYNSCRDRHCPLCQGASRAKWVRERLTELLPVSYFHVVFTVPHELHSLAMSNHKIFYQTLFRSVHDTLLEVCMNPENLGGRIGGLSVLHTWTQKLEYHPHLHCIIPGGALSPDGSHWIEGNPKYLVSVKKLSAVFRGKLLSSLRKSCDRDELFGDKIVHEQSLKKASRKSFVVYAKNPFGNPAQVIKYLGRYTHRVGISEQRIVAAHDGKVSFTWLDRTAGHKMKRLVLPLEEFVDRFLLHILPKGMRKIRYFGYMSNRDRQQSIEHVRKLIPGKLELTSVKEDDIPDSEHHICVKCGKQMSNTLLFSGSGWLSKRLENRSLIHGPEPNVLKVS